MSGVRNSAVAPLSLPCPTGHITACLRRFAKLPSAISQTREMLYAIPHFNTI